MAARRRWSLFSTVLLAALAVAGMPTAAFADPPTTTPATVTVSPDPAAGDLSFHADSTAAMVRFQVDQDPALVAVAVAGDGSASVVWPSWGYPNGNHTVTAADCSDAVTCGTPSAPTSFDLANEAPVVTSPAAGSSLRGGFTITATSTGGALQFLVDGTAVGFDSTAPYSFDYRGTALTQGSHTTRVIQCSADLTRCAGPASVLVGFSATVLHPNVASISPTPFSPNGDRVRDTTKVTISLPEAMAVRLSVINSSAATVRTVNLGSLGTGNHYWTWNGMKNDGRRASNDTYTVKVTATKLVNDVSVTGSASRTVRLDTVAPSLASVTGNRATFYPYRDGYRDTFAPGVTLGDAGTLTLTVKNSSGKAVRTISGARAKGRTSVAWNGRYSSGKAVPAGTYTWTYTVGDPAGNRRTTSRYSVVVSSRHLVSKSATITKNGDSHYAVKGNLTYCVGYSDSLSFFDHGVWLENVCDPDFDGAAVVDAYYSFAVPAAIKYGNMSAKTYGFTLSENVPTEIFAAYYRTSGDFDMRFVKVTTGAARWYSLGTVSGAARASSTHRVKVTIGVDNTYNSGGFSSDFDIKYVRLTLTYYVLS